MVVAKKTTQLGCYYTFNRRICGTLYRFQSENKKARACFLGAQGLLESSNITVAASKCQHQPVHPPTTVPHELKLSIWWNETDAPLRIKLAEPHTLVESAVIDGD